MMEGREAVLLSHLPAIFSECDDLRKLLSLFEAVLLDSGAAPEEDGTATPRERDQALAELISSIPLLFDPLRTPDEFVPWLSRWVALSHAEGLPLERQRRLLARIVPLYGKRGTREYLERLLKFHLPAGSHVDIAEEGPPGFRIGAALVGVDTQFGGEKPYWFSVVVKIARHGDPESGRHDPLSIHERRISRVIDLAKPAHTLYDLRCEFE